MTTEPTGSVPVAERGERTAWRRALSIQRRVPALQILFLVITIVVGLVTLPGFGNPMSLMSILVLSSLVGLAALGQTAVILVGGFDMSVSGFIVASALVVTQLTTSWGIDFGLALAIAVVGSAVFGGIVGYICHRFRVDPIIITLAMGSVALGLTQVASNGAINGAAPDWLTGLTSPRSTTFGIPIPPIIAIWIVVIVIMAVFFHRTTTGRRMYATGANPRAAELALVKTRRIWIGTFAFSAVCSALAGVMLAAFAGSVDASLGDPYLFQGIAAVIVGGTVFGGPGDYTRTVVGALLLTFLTTVLIGNGLPNAAQQVLYGVVILLALAVYGREKRVRDRL